MKKHYESGIEKLENITDINRLYETDRNLYYRVLRKAKLQNKSIKEYLEEQGYIYNVVKKRRLSISEDEIIYMLEEKYIGKKVIYLSKNIRLYSLVMKRAEKDNQTINEWLEERGFEYIKTRRPSKSDYEIVTDLLGMYPDGVIRKLSSENINLYQMIHRRSDNIKEYCKSLGFEYPRRT